MSESEENSMELPPQKSQKQEARKGSPRGVESDVKPNSYRESEMSQQQVAASPAAISDNSLTETDYASIEKKKAGEIGPVLEQSDNEAQF